MASGLELSEITEEKRPVKIRKVRAMRFDDRSQSKYISRQTPNFLISGDSMYRR